MRISWLAVILVAGACGSKDEPAPASAPKDASARVAIVPKPPADATVAADAAVPADAAPRAWGPPVDLATLPELGAAGPSGDVSVHAADAHGGWIRQALARHARASFVELGAPAVRVTGRIGPTTIEHAWKVSLAAVTELPARLIKAKSGVKIRLTFVEASPLDFYRFLGNIVRENVVVGATGLPLVDMWLRGIPAAQTLTILTERLGLRDERHGKLHWVHGADGASLDRDLLARKGPGKLALDVRGARAAEIYAMLANRGILDGGAACDAGEPMTFRLKDAPLGQILAVTAALSGQAPTPGVSCAAGNPATTVDFEVLAILRVDAVRVAVLRGAGGAPIVVERGAAVGGYTITEIAESHVLLGAPDGSARSFPIYPDDLTTGDAVPVRPADPTIDPQLDYLRPVVVEGRLAATIIRGNKKIALLELPDGTWYVLDPDNLKQHHRQITVEPGKVIYDLLSADPATPPLTGEAVLRKATP